MDDKNDNFLQIFPLPPPPINGNFLMFHTPGEGDPWTVNIRGGAGGSKFIIGIAHCNAQYSSAMNESNQMFCTPQRVLANPPIPTTFWKHECHKFFDVLSEPRYILF